jgi:hypothetical protein
MLTDGLVTECARVGRRTVTKRCLLDYHADPAMPTGSATVRYIAERSSVTGPGAAALVDSDTGAAVATWCRAELCVRRCEL